VGRAFVKEGSTFSIVGNIVGTDKDKGGKREIQIYIWIVKSGRMVNLINC